MHFHVYRFSPISLVQLTVTRPNYSHPLHNHLYTSLRDMIRREMKVNHHHHHHHISCMELGHLLTRSGLMYPEVSSKVYHDSFCQLGSSISLAFLIYFETFYLHVVSSFSCIPIICPKLLLFLTPLQFVYLFCNRR